MKCNPLRLLLTLCALILLHACATNNIQTQEDRTLEPDYALSAENYLDQAQNVSGQQRYRLQLSAAGRLIHDGMHSRARQILRDLDRKRLSPALASEKRILEARLALARHQPKTALKTLSRIDDVTELSPYQQITYHESLAQAFQQTHKTLNSVEERLILESLLPNDASRVDNRRELWRSLSSLPPTTLSSLDIETSDNEELSAWLELALIPKQQRHAPQQMFSELQNWQRKFPNHPGQAMLPPSLSRAATNLLPKPTQIAVLLPLSGPWSEPGKATRDGIMHAYYEALQSHDTSAKIKLYDTHQNSATELYAKAIQQGADFVIGPLLKSNVDAITKVHHPVPTLTLNRSDKNGAARQNYFQFALSPVDEAAQAAEKAWRDGHRNTLIIAPVGAWGESLAKAYAEKTNALGAKIVDSYFYTNNDDFNRQIKTLLGIQASTERKQKLSRLLGKRLKFLARRRQDIDAIFLVALPSTARQIRPLLKFYYAGNIPIYATSSLYAGIPSPNKDSDLNGIIFPDMPFVFENQVKLKTPIWPEYMSSYNRLYALGLDAFSLTYLFNQLTLLPELGVTDATGILYLNNQNQIMRQLEWAKFSAGKPELLQQRSSIP